MKRLILRLIGIACLAALAGAARGQGNINFGGGFLLTGGGLEVPDDSVVLAVAATNGGGFSAVQAGSSLSVGSYLNGNDLIIGATTTFTDSGHGGNFTMNPGGTPAGTAGDAIELVWFANGSAGATTALAGSDYGSFTTTTALDGSDPWVVPSNGVADLSFFTLTTTLGTYDPSVAETSMTVMSAVPEPADWGLIAGVAALAFATAKRRLKPADAAA